MGNAPVAARRRRGGVDRSHDPLDRFLDAAPRDRLSQVVECVQFEGLDCGAVVGADEHQLRRRGEAPHHARELEPVEVGHPDVEEDRVIALARELGERVAAVERALHFAHAR